MNLYLGFKQVWQEWLLLRKRNVRSSKVSNKRTLSPVKGQPFQTGRFNREGLLRQSLNQTSLNKARLWQPFTAISKKFLAEPWIFKTQTWLIPFDWSRQTPAPSPLRPFQKKSYDLRPSPDWKLRADEERFWSSVQLIW